MLLCWLEKPSGSAKNNSSITAALHTLHISVPRQLSQICRSTTRAAEPFVQQCHGLRTSSRLCFANHHLQPRLLLVAVGLACRAPGSVCAPCWGRRVCCSHCGQGLVLWGRKGLGTHSTQHSASPALHRVHPCFLSTHKFRSACILHCSTGGEQISPLWICI